MKKSTGMGLAVLGLTVGFAAVATQLTINGSTTISGNATDFEEKIIFTAAAIDADAKAAGAIDPVISDDGKKITFTTQEMKDLTDKAVLTYTVSNESTNYNAQFATPAVVCKADTGTTQGDLDTYLTLTNGTALDGTIINAGGSKENTLTVALKQSYAEEDTKTITYVCTIDATAVEATNN